MTAIEWVQMTQCMECAEVTVKCFDENPHDIFRGNYDKAFETFVHYINIQRIQKGDEKFNLPDKLKICKDCKYGEGKSTDKMLYCTKIKHYVQSKRQACINFYELKFAEENECTNRN